jgi:hypothetical protein
MERERLYQAGCLPERRDVEIVVSSSWVTTPASGSDGRRRAGGRAIDGRSASRFRPMCPARMSSSPVVLTTWSIGPGTPHDVVAHSGGSALETKGSETTSRAAPLIRRWATRGGTSTVFGLRGKSCAAVRANLSPESRDRRTPQLALRSRVRRITISSSMALLPRSVPVRRIEEPGIVGEAASRAKQAVKRADLAAVPARHTAVQKPITRRRSQLSAVVVSMFEDRSRGNVHVSACGTHSRASGV